MASLTEKKVALLVTHTYYPGRPDVAEDNFVEEKQVKQLRAACAALHIQTPLVFWQDAGTAWSQYDAVCPLMAWVYPRQPELFLQRLAEIEAAGVRLVNSGAVLRENMDKNYLARLASRGAPVPPTVSVEMCTEQVRRRQCVSLRCLAYLMLLLYNPALP
eukprot:m.94987 g.94987  ORF g.94987 m.94987 type:complete len:160 (-) comp15435_c0_seq3:126-605(-)